MENDEEYISFILFRFQLGNTELVFKKKHLFVQIFFGIFNLLSYSSCEHCKWTRGNNTLVSLFKDDIIYRMRLPNNRLFFFLLSPSLIIYNISLIVVFWMFFFLTRGFITKSEVFTTVTKRQGRLKCFSDTAWYFLFVAFWSTISFFVDGT